MIWNVIMALAVTLMAIASPGNGKQGDMLSQLTADIPTRAYLGPRTA
jgi:hypothetical protein